MFCPMTSDTIACEALSSIDWENKHAKGSVYVYPFGRVWKGTRGLITNAEN